MENPEKPRLKVTDRRHFTREGELRDEPQAEESPRPGEETGAPRDKNERSRPTAPRTSAAIQPAEALAIDFSRLVLSLARQALMLMGEEPNPISGRAEADPEGAHETIDILMLLRQKTEGNLSGDESALLNQMIYELQMRFAQKGGP